MHIVGTNFICDDVDLPYMKDAAGAELKEGDRVLWINTVQNSVRLKTWRVEGFTKRMVQIGRTNRYGNRKHTTVSAGRLVKTFEQ